MTEHLREEEKRASLVPNKLVFRRYKFCLRTETGQQKSKPTMAANSENRSSETFRLFSSFGGNFNFGFGFYDSPAVPPPPPCVEVLPTEGFEDKLRILLTILRVCTEIGIVFCEIHCGACELGRTYFAQGGLKLWEGSLDLVKALRSEVGNGHLSFTRKRVLELGCGHGLPAIFACREGAAAVHFQDFNAEVLKCLTIPNVNANIEKVSQLLKANATDCESGTEVRFFAGDWSEIDKLLSYARDTNKETDCSSGNGLDHGCTPISCSCGFLPMKSLPSISESQGRLIITPVPKTHLVLKVEMRELPVDRLKRLPCILMLGR
ncbi:hypothetical protein L484_026863 [Morus notabilis]|uniref:protein-histidine N-methyltransferase n=1 Tax=Morus notabilis TaxID=981085 RepID=W9R680_9ROSA|nr:hypothetical protein L484_026863 [Morus notabilis]